MKPKVHFISIFSLIIILEGWLTINLQGQQLIYEGMMKGEKVGEIMAIREVNDENVKINVKTNLEVHLLFKIDMELSSESMYVNQSLMQASSVSKVHDHIHSEVQTIKMNNGYKVNIDGNLKETDRKSLIGTDIFYFEEPVSIDSVYSLALGKMLDVVRGEKSNEYYFENDGAKQFHRYQNGILQELEIDHASYSIVFRLKK